MGIKNEGEEKARPSNFISQGRKKRGRVAEQHSRIPKENLKA